MVKKVIMSLVMLICLLVLVPNSQATPILYLWDTANPVGTLTTIVDGGGGDLNGNPGWITFLGAVGSNWNINVTTGSSLSALQPVMDLSSIDSSLGAGTLAIVLLDNFGVVNGPFSTSVGGTLATGGSAQFQMVTGGPPLASLTGITTLLSFVASPFSGTATGSGPVSGLIGLEAWITHGRNGGTSSFDQTGTVPEPSTLLLFGAGLAGVGILRRKLRK